MAEPARKYLTEFLGTFFLVFTVLAAIATAGALAPLAVGGVLAVMVYAGGHVSGGHYNPAVSLAALVRGRLAAPELPGYLAAQFTGAIGAAALGGWIFAHRTGAQWTGKEWASALVVELLFTFALGYVVLSTATSRDHPDNSFYGLAIGLTVTAGALSVGAVSGAAFNPAVAFALAFGGLAPWAHLAVYWVAQMLGGALAGYVFRVLNPEDA